MEFLKYQHIERLGTTETQGIEMGTVWVFPKIDGTNAQLWWTIDERGTGQLHAGSRNRELFYPDDDNQGFFKWCVEERGEALAKFFRDHPKIRLYGEFLVPHTLKTYQETAWKNFYVFDVMLNGCYVPYEDYRDLLTEYDIKFIPAICKVKNPTRDRLIAQLDKNGYLIKDGEGVGEGVVIKNYEYTNPYGRVTWAKIVRNEFKAKHWSNDTTEVKERKEVEFEIVNKYVSGTLVEKEFAKIEEDAGWSSKLIPRLLSTVFYCLIKEESWNFIKDHKNPTIDYKRLNTLTIQRIKELKPEIF